LNDRLAAILAADVAGYKRLLRSGRESQLDESIPMERATVVVPEDNFFVLSSLPPTRAQERLLLAVVLALLVTFLLAAGPLSGIQTTRVAAFVPAYTTALVLTDGITAFLLFSQFAILKTRALLVISSGYLFAALMAIAWFLMFPGVFAPEGLIGGIQGRAYIYFLWHAGFPIFVIVYALTKDADADKRYWRGAVGAAIALSVVVTAVVVAALTFLLAVKNSSLPRVEFDPLRFGSLWQFFAVPMASLIVLALLVLWVRRRSILDFWLMVVMCAYGMEIWLSYPIAYGFGWYASRILGVFSSSLVLWVLLYEITTLYARLLRAVRAQRREREARLMTGDTIAAAIAHEVNQPLGAARNNLTAALNFLDRTPPDLVEVREALACAVEDNDRASTVVRRIRALMQKAPTRIDSVNVNEAVREVIKLTYGEALKNRVSVRTQLADDLPLIQGDEVQLQQVILNLILNAVQAMGAVTNGTREVLITTSQTEPNEICLGVQDTGPGLSAETLPRLFEPFYTTKPDGMGMGLAICRSIIEAHGGRLWATRCEPGGALFQFTIPAD
jgi:signal transduction histidine kinase